MLEAECRAAYAASDPARAARLQGEVRALRAALDQEKIANMAGRHHGARGLAASPEDCR